MSYQAITDIIVNQSQLQDFQLSATVKDSPTQQPSVSFSDILTSYNQENSTEETKPVEQKETSDTVKTENVEKSEKTSDSQVVKDNKTEENEEQTVEKTDSKVKDTRIDDKKEIKNRFAAKNENSAEVKNTEDLSGSVKKAEKNVKDLKKDKKLSEKDFSRLEELAGKVEADGADSSKLSELTKKSVNTEKKSAASKNNDDEIDLKINNDSSMQLSLNETAGDNSAQTSDFDFFGGEEKSKKQFTLDKEGKITVEDLRTKPEIQNETEQTKKPLVKASEVKLTNENTAVMSVELNPNAEADVLSLNTQTAASTGSNFQAMLSNQLTNVAPEFVKAGNLVLKDNNQGTINLILHPDDLGNVKIHLSLDGKTLSGHITVATKEALQVFKDNAETLREAFIKSGFDGASFDVAMNNGGSFNQNMDFGSQDDGTSLFAKRVYGDSAGGLSAEVDDIFENIEDITNYSVNIVA